MKNLIWRSVLVLGAAILIPACDGGQYGASAPSASMVPKSMDSSGDNGQVNARLDVLEQAPGDTVMESNPNHPFLYTVPAGQSLIVTYFRGGSGDTFTIGGASVGNVSVGRIVANEGEVVVGGTIPGGTPKMAGYLIDKAKAPGVGVHVTASTYTVPAGKTLYVTHVVAGVNSGGGQIDIDGKNLIFLGSAPAGEDVFIPVAAGKVVNATNTAALHGYLK